jgi:hypothetical protein
MVACLRIALQFAVSSRKSKKNLLKNYFQLFIIGKNFPKCFLEVSKSCFRSTCRGAGGCNANPGSLNVGNGRNIGGPEDAMQIRGCYMSTEVAA